MVGTTLILFEGLPLLSSVRMAVGRTIAVGGKAMAIGTVAAGGASAVYGIIRTISIAATGGGGINPVRAYLSLS